MTTRVQKIEQMPWRAGPIETFRVKPGGPFEPFNPFADLGAPFGVSDRTVSRETVEPIDVGFTVLPGLHFHARLAAYVDRDGEPVVVFMGDPRIEAVAYARKGQTEAELLQARKDLDRERAVVRRYWTAEQEDALRVRGRKACERVLNRLGEDLGW